MMGSLSPPHKQLHQVGGCHWKKHSKAIQLRVRDFERHALQNKHNQSSIYYYACVCAMLITQFKKKTKTWHVISDY